MRGPLDEAQDTNQLTRCLVPENEVYRVYIRKRPEEEESWDTEGGETLQSMARYRPKDDSQNGDNGYGECCHPDRTR